MFAAMKRVSLITAVLTLALPAAALADTTTVDTAAGGSCARGGTCKTISDAVGVSQASDTLAVKSGSYPEVVTIPNTLTGLTVNADPGAVVSGSVAVNAANVTVHGLTVSTTTGSAAALSAVGKLTLTDATLISTVGSAMSLSGATGSLVQRSTIASFEPATATSDGITQGAAGLTVDSSIVIGGAKGAAFRVTTDSGSADATLDLNHVTTIAAASGKSLVLDGSSKGLPIETVGDITLTVRSSIIHGASTVTGDPGIFLVRPANVVKATFANSDATAVTATDGTTVPGTGGPTPDSAIFGPKLRLKFGSAVIDKGGAVANGESGTDIDGDPRSAGGASDIGADEFVNHAPGLTLAVTPTAPTTSQTVAATGTATDKEGLADIAVYVVDWGDGSRKDQATSATLHHVYEKPGTYTLSMVVADKSGALSPVATQSVTVTDGTPPQLQVTTPKAGATVKLSGKKVTPLIIKGVDFDFTGIKTIELALTKTGKKCLQYTGKKFVKSACAKVVFLKAKLKGTGFRLDTRKGVRVPKGSYQIRARGTDVAGNATTTFVKADKTLISFKVR
jgi:hypothetical protein